MREKAARFGLIRSGRSARFDRPVEASPLWIGRQGAVQLAVVAVFAYELGKPVADTAGLPEAAHRNRPRAPARAELLAMVSHFNSRGHHSNLAKQQHERKCHGSDGYFEHGEQDERP